MTPEDGTPTPAPPRRRAADRGEEALVSERLNRLERLEEQERAGQAELLALAREGRDLTRELVDQGKRREDREVEALEIERARARASEEAKTRRLDAELEERRTMRAWLRTAVGDRLVPLLLGAAGTALTGALAWWFGGSP